MRFDRTQEPGIREIGARPTPHEGADGAAGRHLRSRGRFGMYRALGFEGRRGGPELLAYDRRCALDIDGPIEDEIVERHDANRSAMLGQRYAPTPMGAHRAYDVFGARTDVDRGDGLG